jgi:type II secretory pathway component PulF
VAVIVTVVVPKVIESFEGQMQLPLPTLILKQTADFSAAYWWAVLGGAAAAVFIARRTYADPAWRLRIDRWLLKAPILGRLLRDVAVARFTRTLATLTAAGIPAVTALRITKGTLGNKAMERVVDDVCEQVSAGRTIADPMEQSGYFPPMLVQIVNLGERSGRLEELLGQAAGAFEDRTESSIKLFTTALPPLLVAVMACVVGLVVLAVLLPFIEYQELVLSR